MKDLKTGKVQVAGFVDKSKGPVDPNNPDGTNKAPSWFKEFLNQFNEFKQEVLTQFKKHKWIK